MTAWQIWERAFFGLVLWREARGETYGAKVAVAWSIVTRTAHPSWWGRTLIQILKKPWQYSSVTDPHDIQLIKWPDETDHLFEECMQIVCDVLDTKLLNPVPEADSYYDDSLQGDMRPKWARDNPDRFIAKVGRINFYSMRGA